MFFNEFKNFYKTITITLQPKVDLCIDHNHQLNGNINEPCMNQNYPTIHRKWFAIFLHPSRWCWYQRIFQQLWGAERPFAEWGQVQQEVFCPTPVTRVSNSKGGWADLLNGRSILANEALAGLRLGGSVDRWNFSGWYVTAKIGTGEMLQAIAPFHFFGFYHNRKLPHYSTKCASPILSPNTAERRDVLENTLPEAQEISQGRGFCTPRPQRLPKGEAQGQSQGPSNVNVFRARMCIKKYCP